MTREEQLVFCKKCTNRKMDPRQGLICGLTDQKATFDVSCNDYDKDPAFDAPESNEELGHESAMAKLSDKALRDLRGEQNYGVGLAGGIVAGVLGALLWAAVTVITQYQIGYMAIAVGAGVGFTIRYTGKGIDQMFGVTGAIIAILSCLFGNFLGVVGFAANEYSMGYLETLMSINLGEIIPIMTETFSGMDIFFYGIAAYEGYKFAFRTFTDEEIADMENKDQTIIS